LRSLNDITGRSASQMPEHSLLVVHNGKDPCPRPVPAAQQRPQQRGRACSTKTPDACPTKTA
jgi:hypothetical protein